MEEMSQQAQVHAMWGLALNPSLPQAERLTIALQTLDKMQKLLYLAQSENDERRTAIAYKIRAELVCCMILDTKDSGKAEREGHAICYWGEAAARIAENRPADEDGF